MCRNWKKRRKMSDPKPIIGITGYHEREKSVDTVKVNRTYCEAVGHAGGIPLVIPIFMDGGSAPEVLDRIDGLLLSGGPDVLPLIFDETPHHRIGAIDARRDQWEIALFKEAYGRDMPILGICRGVQLMNVALGGSLYQDIHSQVKLAHAHYAKDTPMDTLFHRVKIETGRRLHGIFGKDSLMVNSYHHQALKHVAEGLVIGAVSRDGIVEGVEAPDKRFAVGVQWHPEALWREHADHERLFKAFVESAKEKREEGIRS